LKGQSDWARCRNAQDRPAFDSAPDWDDATQTAQLPARRCRQLDITKLSRLSQAKRSAISDRTTGLIARSDVASLSKPRNWLAHICFGTAEVAGLVVDPFARTNNQSPYLI
jgi:hypothetical protein